MSEPSKFPAPKPANVEILRRDRHDVEISFELWHHPTGAEKVWVFNRFPGEEDWRTHLAFPATRAGQYGEDLHDFGVDAYEIGIGYESKDGRMSEIVSIGRCEAYAEPAS